MGAFLYILAVSCSFCIHVLGRRIEKLEERNKTMSLELAELRDLVGKLSASNFK